MKQQPILVTTGNEQPLTDDQLQKLAIAASAVTLDAVKGAQFMRLLKEILVQNMCIAVCVLLLDLFLGVPLFWPKYLIWPIFSALNFSSELSRIHRAIETAYNAGTSWQGALHITLMSARVRQLPEPEFSKEQLANIHADVTAFIVMSNVKTSLNKVRKVIDEALATIDDPRCHNCDQRLGVPDQPCPVCKEPPSGAKTNSPDSTGSGPTEDGCRPIAVGDACSASTDTQAP
jgi:hypothetical protein